MTIIVAGTLLVSQTVTSKSYVSECDIHPAKIKRSMFSKKKKTNQIEFPVQHRRISVRIYGWRCFVRRFPHFGFGERKKSSGSIWPCVCVFSVHGGIPVRIYGGILVVFDVNMYFGGRNNGPGSPRVLVTSLKYVNT